MIVLFLDMDGVLNTWASLEGGWRTIKYGSVERRYPILCKTSIERLNRITEATGAVIVMSSTWRKCSEEMFAALLEHLKAEGVTADIIGRTPTLPGKRGEEIQKWIDDSPHQVDGIVILDDDSDMVHLLPWLVKTSMEHGIEERHVQLAIDATTKLLREEMDEKGF